MTEDSEERPPMRPGYLVFALVAAWVTGVRVAHEGYVMTRIINDPLAGDSLAVGPALRDAIVAGALDHATAVLPLSIAQMLLGGLLLIVSTLALFRGRLSVSFMVQVLLANAGVMLVAHVVAKPLRDAMIAVLAENPQALGPEFADVERDLLVTAYEWAFLLGVLFQLVVLGLLILALTRPRARRFLAHSPSPPKEG